MLKNTDADLTDLFHLRPQLCVELPGKVVRKDGCWEEAQWDTFPAHFETQLWYIPGSPTLKHHMATSTSKLRQHLNRWESPQYDFHWHEDPVPPPLVLYRKYQQDAMLATWEGLVAGTDDSVDLRSESMQGMLWVMGLSLLWPFQPLEVVPLHQFDQKLLVSSKSCVMWQPTMTVEPPC